MLSDTFAKNVLQLTQNTLAQLRTVARTVQVQWVSAHSRLWAGREWFYGSLPPCIRRYCFLQVPKIISWMRHSQRLHHEGIMVISWMSLHCMSHHLISHHSIMNVSPFMIDSLLVMCEIPSCVKHSCVKHFTHDESNDCGIKWMWNDLFTFMVHSRNAPEHFEMPSSHSKCPLRIRNALFTFEMPSSHSEFEMPSSHSECPLHIYNTIIYKSHSWKDHRHLRYAIITYMTFSLFVGIVWSHMAFVAIANESCHTYECVMSHETNKQRHARKQVISHMWMSHVTHVNEACHTYEWSI